MCFVNAYLPNIPLRLLIKVNDIAITITPNTMPNNVAVLYDIVKEIIIYSIPSDLVSYYD
jgi:hypothetical protein